MNKNASKQLNYALLAGKNGILERDSEHAQSN
jgi:hypothetical protein